MKMIVATKENYDDIMELYRAMIGTEGCTWSMDYPNEELLERDLAAQNVFCMQNEEGQIIGTIAIDQDEEVDQLTCWSGECGEYGEVARVCVKEGFKNQGIARKMVSFVMDVLRERGYKGAHYLVSRTNERALASYRKLEFVCVGEEELFGHKWYCYEKSFA